MEREDGRKLTREALEERRKTVILRWKAENKPSEIMDATGACLSTIHQIWRKYQAEGKKSIAVRARGHKMGDCGLLSPEQEALIRKQIIDKHPDQLKLNFALWTHGAVDQLIETFPKIAKRAKSEGADIYWGDETGPRASDVRGRGFLPKGQTPVVLTTATYQNLSMVFAITNKGKVS